MPVLPVGVFPTLQTIMDLARSYVNDMYPGVGGQNGRILTNDAAFTLPYLNEAFETLQRDLRNEGCTFPIKDNVILFNLTPVLTPNPDVQVTVGYDGYFDGNTTHAVPALPSDLMQPQAVWEQTAGNNTPFVPMQPSQGGLPSAFQGPWLGWWDWLNYKIVMVGSTALKNLRLRYTVGQPPITAPPANFATTTVNIRDSKNALAELVAISYGDARGANTTKMSAKYTATLDAMALEWVRQQQNVPYRRPAYGNANDGGPLGSQSNDSGGIS